MCSRAFKVFFLMLLLFAAVWASRLRTRELSSIAELAGFASPPPTDLASLRSPVNQVLDPGLDSRKLARAYLRQPQLAEPAAPEPGADAGSIFADPPPVEAPPPDASPSGGPAAAAADDPPEEEPVEIVFLEDLRARESKKATPNGRKEGERERQKTEKADRERGPEKAVEKSAKDAKSERTPVKADRSKADRAGPERLGPPRSRPVVDPHTLPADAKKTPRPPSTPVVDGRGAEGARPAEKARAKVQDDDPNSLALEVSSASAKSSARISGPGPGTGTGTGTGTKRTVSHVVREKDTLASLARRYFQEDTEKWKAIYAANQARIPNPDDLAVGTVLEIPVPDDGKGAAGKARKAAPGRSAPAVRRG